ncbi:hypothetical protein RUND412_006351, partial [Rhizina undulata]
MDMDVIWPLGGIISNAPVGRSNFSTGEDMTLAMDITRPLAPWWHYFESAAIDGRKIPFSKALTYTE